MGRMFDVDSPLMDVLNKITNLVVLNLCFLVSCIPVITIGAGLTALYSVNLKMIRSEESYVFKSYWKAWKENFAQSTKVWLMVLIIGGIFAADFRIIPLLPKGISTFFGIVVLAIFILFVITLLYVFPYMARFRDGIKASVKNAFIMSIAHIGYTVTIVLITGACVGISIFNLSVMLRAIFIWIVIGAGLLTFIQSFFFRKVFDRYEHL